MVNKNRRNLGGPGTNILFRDIDRTAEKLCTQLKLFGTFSNCPDFFRSHSCIVRHFNSWIPSRVVFMEGIRRTLIPVFLVVLVNILVHVLPGDSRRCPLLYAHIFTIVPGVIPTRAASHAHVLAVEFGYRPSRSRTWSPNWRPMSGKPR